MCCAWPHPWGQRHGAGWPCARHQPRQFKVWSKVSNSWECRCLDLPQQILKNCVASYSLICYIIAFLARSLCPTRQIVHIIIPILLLPLHVDTLWYVSCDYQQLSGKCLQLNLVIFSTDLSTTLVSFWVRSTVEPCSTTVRYVHTVYSRSITVKQQYCSISLQYPCHQYLYCIYIVR